MLTFLSLTTLSTTSILTTEAKYSMYLAEAVVERKGFYPQGFHALQLLLIEVLQLVHG